MLSPIAPDNLPAATGKKSGAVALLVGQREDPGYDYLRDLLDSVTPEYGRRLTAGIIDPWFEGFREFLEGHMISYTPSLLLLRDGKQTAMISGWVTADQLRGELNKITRKTTAEAFEEALEALGDDAPDLSVRFNRSDSLPLLLRTGDNAAIVVPDGFEMIGLLDDGRPIFAPVNDAGETPSV